MVGYVIRKWAVIHKNNGKGVCMIATGFVIELAAACLKYGYLTHKIVEEDMKYGLTGPQCPLIVISSIFIFTGFSMLNIKKDFSTIAENTFLIYLIHAGVWNILEIGLKKILGEGDNRAIIPVGIVSVFLISYVLAAAYKKVFKLVNGRFRLSDKLCKLVKLG